MRRIFVGNSWALLIVSTMRISKKKKKNRHAPNFWREIIKYEASHTNMHSCTACVKSGVETSFFRLFYWEFGQMLVEASEKFSMLMNVNDARWIRKFIFWVTCSSTWKSEKFSVPTTECAPLGLSNWIWTCRTLKWSVRPRSTPDIRVLAVALIVTHRIR